MPFRRKKAAAAAVFKSGSIAPPFLPFIIELFKILVLQLLRGELKKKKKDNEEKRRDSPTHRCEGGCRLC